MHISARRAENRPGIPHIKIMTTIAINGFGRIGRLVFRALVEQGHLGTTFNVVAVGDIVPADNLAYLLKYDSTQGRFAGTVSSKKSSPDLAEDDIIVVNGHDIKVVSARTPGRPAVEGTRRGSRHRVHRPLHRCGKSQGPHHRRCQESHHLRSRQG